MCLRVRVKKLSVLGLPGSAIDGRRMESVRWRDDGGVCGLHGPLRVRQTSEWSVTVYGT